MVYKVIGLMSGSSLDGLDIVYTQLEEVRGQWAYEVIHATCVPYTDEMVNDLKYINQQGVPEFLKLHTRYGRYIGESVNAFIEAHQLHHKVHFIASHGHTVFHEPQNHTTFQVGDGATIAAVTGLPVISDLRSLDVALGGQGAPIVPIGDKLFFSNYDYRLNIGGIANITVPDGENIIAFDICPANQVLNVLAERNGQTMDEDGKMAERGHLLTDVLSELNDASYYKVVPPKSLSNEEAQNLVFPSLYESSHDNADLLHTMVQHITDQVVIAISKYPVGKPEASMIITGGGAFNKFLVAKLQEALAPFKVAIMIPDATTIMYKEAVIMALIGALRWREENTVLSSATGATRDSIGGAMWMGHTYN